jgi:hypothetical protein
LDATVKKSVVAHTPITIDDFEKKRQRTTNKTKKKNKVLYNLSVIMQNSIYSIFTAYRDNDTIAATVLNDEDTMARDVFAVQIVKAQKEGLPRYGDNVIKRIEVPMSVVRSNMASDADVKETTRMMRIPTMPPQARLRAVRFLTDDVIVINFEESIFLVHMDGSVAPEDILWFHGFRSIEYHPPVVPAAEDATSETATASGVTEAVAVATGPQAHQLLLTTFKSCSPIGSREFTTTASIVTLSSDLKSVVSTHTVQPLPTHAFATKFIDGGNRYVIGGEGKTTVFDSATNTVLYDCVHEATETELSECMGIQQVLVPGIVGTCLSLTINMVVHCVYDDTGKFQLRVVSPKVNGRRGLLDIPSSWTLLK